jgi:gliding motility-associated-like protein
LNAGNPLTVDLGADLVVDNGTDIQVTANINGSNIGSIEWTPLICEGCTNAFVTILSDTIFNVLVTDEGGCVAKDQLFVKVKDNADAFTPNVFSPNGDGINDTWRIYSSNPQARVKQLSIYDRWGGMVFTTSGFHPSDNESAWDGTVNGKKCGQGVYVFMAEIELRPGKTIQLKGEILISR